MSLNNNIRNKDLDLLDASNCIVYNITASNYKMHGGLTLQTADYLSTKNILNGLTYDQAILGWDVNSNANRYEAYKLQSFINNSNGELTRLGVDPLQSRLTITVETSNNGYLMLEDRITVPTNMTLNFRCPVLMGNYGQILVYGLDRYIPANSTSKPLLITSAAIGESNFTIWRNLTSAAEMTTWVDGVLIRSRNEEEENGEDLVVAWCSNIPGTSNYNLVTKQPSQFTLDAYIDGFRRYASARPTTNTSSIGQTNMKVNDASIFTIGDVVSVFDSRVVSEIYGSNTSTNKSTGAKFWWSGNRAKHEMKRITAVDSNNHNIFFESPLVYSYDNSNTTYVTLLNQKENVEINNLFAIQYEPVQYNPPTITRNNKHKLQLQKAVNCTVNNYTFTDCANILPKTVQFPNINAAFRMDKCFHCRLINSKLIRANNIYTSSSIGYAAVLFSSSKLHFDNNIINGFRHGMLLSGTNTSLFTNFNIHDTKGSALDLHGSCEHENTFMNFNIITSPATVALDVTNSNNDAGIIEMVQVGNSTHSGGASRNKFMNFVLSYGRPQLQPGTSNTSNLNNVYGIQLIGNSRHNVFQNFEIDNVNIPVYIADNTRGRLNSNLMVQNTTFNNFTLRGCDKGLMIDGAANTSNQYSYLSNATIAYTTNTIGFDSNTTTNSAVNYQHYYSNWTLQLDSAGSNYRVLDYDATTATITIDGTFNPAISSNVPFTLHDSNVDTTWQIDTTKIYNWNCASNNSDTSIPYDFIYIKHAKNSVITNGIFNASTNTSNINLITSYSNKGISIFNNISSSNHQFLNIYYTTPGSVANNLFTSIISGYSNMILDNGANSNLTIYNNNGVSFVDSYSASGTTIYNQIPRKLGYSNNPATPALVINNSNGCLGVGGQSNAYAPLHFKDSTNSKKICLYETTSNNPNQWYGFGVDAGSFLRYQSASSTTGGHYWMCASSSNASAERMRLTATGCLSIGSTTPSNAMLYIKASNALVPFIAFSGSIGTASNIDTTALGNYYGKVMVNIIGIGNKFIPLYDS